MTPKEYLMQYKALDTRINAKLRQVEELRAKAQSAGGSGGGSGSHGSLPYDRVGELTAKIISLENEINAEIDRLVDLQRDIRRRIADIPDAQLQTVLELHYINCFTLEQTAVAMSYSYPHICRLHGRALAQIKMI